MKQYNLRLEDNIKQKAKELAKRKGLSESALYQKAIEEYLNRNDVEEYFQKLMDRIVSVQDKSKILSKLKRNKADVLFEEDKMK